jgi:ABC-2 type transport system ATP-binding protein
MDNNTVIRTSRLTKVFGHLTAVDAIDMQVEAATIHGFVGPNGAGKTTTMKMLIGALRATEGDGWIKDQAIGSKDARALIGYAPEHAVLYDDMTAHEYLVYMARVCGIDARTAGRRADYLLDWLDLGGFTNAKGEGFSAGMRQRLCLAQALIHEPEVLILDEPTANMDPTGRLSILDRLRQLKGERNTTILLSSHILSELEQVADSITMIYKGRIVVQGDIDEIRGRFAENQYMVKTSQNDTVLGYLKDQGVVTEGWLDDEGFMHLASEDGPGLRREILKAVVRYDADLEHLSQEQVSLENIYRETVGMEKE